MAKLSIRNGVITYLLCACTVTVVCTVFFVLSCNCDAGCNRLSSGALHAIKDTSGLIMFHR